MSHRKPPTYTDMPNATFSGSQKSKTAARMHEAALGEAMQWQIHAVFAQLHPAAEVLDWIDSFFHIGQLSLWVLLQEKAIQCQSLVVSST